MPLWRIFSHPDTFNLEQRAALAHDVTALYGLLPAFYVNVIFINSGENDIWIGGKVKTNFVRIVIEQIARALPDDTTENGRARRKGWMDRINETLKPHIQARPELEWEHHIYETPRDLWRVGGINPPPTDSAAEKMWKEQDKALPYEL